MEKNSQLNAFSVVSSLIISFIFFVKQVGFTAFSQRFSNTNTILEYVAFVLTILLVFWGLAYKLTIRKLFFFVALLIIILLTGRFSGYRSNYVQLLLLAFAVGGLQINAKQLIKIFTVTMSISIIMVVALSLVGILPKSGTASKIIGGYQETVYFYGFNHPNAFGTFLSVAYIGYSYIHDFKNKRKLIFYGILVTIIVAIAGARTAALMSSSAVVAVYLVSIKRPTSQLKKHKLSRFSYLVAPFGALLAYWLGMTYPSDLSQRINVLIPARPMLWNIYLANYGFKWFSIPPKLDFSVGSVTATRGNGALDGGYIYVLVYLGLVALFIYFAMIASIIYFGRKYHNYYLSFIGLIIAVGMIPESPMMLFFENPFLLFAGYFVLAKDSRCMMFKGLSEMEKDTNES
ncbi:MAG: hypothetical protein ABF933_06615 [Leuconostoc citreum]